MNLSELGFDFSNLQTCTIRKKNYILPLVSGILAISFFPIYVAFQVLFILKVDIDINDVPTSFGDPSYMSFFGIFLPIFGFISVFFIALGIYGLIKHPSNYMIIDKDKTNFNTFYYIYDNRRKEFLYLTENFLIAYNDRLKSIREETNPEVISKTFGRFIFWNQFASLRDYKIKHKKNKTVLKFKVNYRFSKSYHFSNDVHIVPRKITEIISSSSATRSNIQGFSTYYFESVNRRQQVSIHPEIKKKLASFT